MTEQQIQLVRVRYPAGTEHKYVFGRVQGIIDLQSRSEQLADLVALFKLNEYQRDWVNQQLSELDGRRAEIFAWSVRQELEHWLRRSRTSNIAIRRSGMPISLHSPKKNIE
jgi:hypothetical protein